MSVSLILGSVDLDFLIQSILKMVETVFIMLEL